MSFAALPDNLTRVREDVAEALARAGLAHRVRIVAVTKGHPVAAIRAAMAAGLEDVGENRVQEAVRKHEELGKTGCTWHLIGHLQTNKAKLVPGRFGFVQSIDSIRVAEAVDRANAAAGLGPTDVLVQVNLAREAQKSGCDVAAVPALVERVSDLGRLSLRGLMTMAPFTDDECVQREIFAGLRVQREALEAQGYDLPELSMGMSNDYQAAVAEGATMLRLGTVLFGARPT